MSLKEEPGREEGEYPSCLRPEYGESAGRALVNSAARQARYVGTAPQIAPATFGIPFVSLPSP
jgi:hypothetical protein